MLLKLLLDDKPFHHSSRYRRRGGGGGVADRIIDGPIYKTVKANDSVYLHKKLSDFNRRGGARFLSIGNFERNAHKSTSFLPRLESFK